MSKPTPQSRSTAAMRLQYALEDLRLTLPAGVADTQEWQALDMSVDRAVVELTS